MIQILLVEDENKLCHYLSLLCETEGMKVVSCSSGKEAIEIAKKLIPDVLVTDWLLKDEIDGLALSREIRKIHSHLKTVLITGLPIEDLKRQAKDDPIFAFVPKPFDFTDLSQVIKKALIDPKNE